MKSGQLQIKKIIASFRVGVVNLDELTTNHFVQGEVPAMIHNASVVAELAQKLCDPRGKGSSAELSAEIVRLCADIKLEAMDLMASRLSQPQAEQLLNKLKSNYRKMVRRMTELGETKVPGLGLAIPQLL